MKWYTANEKPRENTQILIYRPIYEGRNDRMVFKVVDSTIFLLNSSMFKDVTNWAYLSKPKQ